jgi:5'-nucleotidase
MTMRKAMTIMLLMVVSLTCLSIEFSAGQMPERKSRLFVVLSNDDGFDAPGLRALVDVLQPMADVVVAAPAAEQRGKGHGLLLRDPIFVTERKQAQGPSWFAIDAPPASSVRLAVESLMPHRPDLVISGINRGDKLGATV